MSTFKITLTAIFAVCLVIGIALFASSKANTAQNSNLTVWGVLSPQAFQAAYKASSIFSNKKIIVSYVQKSAAAIDVDLVNSLADGNGPDLIITREDYLYKNRNRLLVIPYTSYSQRNFKDTFIEDGEIFLSPAGVIAFPLLVDPLVMYWNRDIFSNNNVATPPSYWDEFYNLVGVFTRRDSSAGISSSALAMGEWNNITNAKDILSLLLLQAGTSITVNTADQGVISTINSSAPGKDILPGESAVNFYTQFSNPTSPNYSWNRSLPDSQTFFLSGNLAVYFGPSSDIYSIQQKNPNLNFDVAAAPQIRGNDKKISFGHMFAVATVKQSKQIGAAFLLMNALAESDAEKALVSAVNLPPARRDLLSQLPTGAESYKTVFYKSALTSHSWIDPDPSKSSNTFRDMIQSITSGQSRTSEALSQANSELNVQLGR
jgi:ABC-type glycerol-3-phosphate transport system substrate-binding protein